MGCNLKLYSPNNPNLFKFPKKRPSSGNKRINFSSPSSLDSQNHEIPTISTTIKTKTQISKSEISTVNFKSLRACKLGISKYPDFEYDAQGGTGFGSAKLEENGKVSVSFDIETLYIPSLMSKTTKFLGLPLPPLLKIDIVPELFQGYIDRESGKEVCNWLYMHMLQVDLEFKAKFLFSIGNIYKGPPLLVKTMLTSEESEGKFRSGKGERLDKELGQCRLVGVAIVEPIDDFLLNSFLSLPTECIANLNAIISFS